MENTCARVIAKLFCGKCETELSEFYVTDSFCGKGWICRMCHTLFWLPLWEDLALTYKAQGEDFGRVQVKIGSLFRTTADTGGDTEASTSIENGTSSTPKT